MVYPGFHVGDEVGAEDGQELFEVDLCRCVLLPTKSTTQFDHASKS